MVIPAVLFQVKYAAQTKIFLSEHFERINIITFNKLVFDGIQQEIVLLLCEKIIEKNNEKGIRVFECESLETLKNIDVSALNKLEIKPLEGIIFTNLDFKENSKAQKPIYLFLPSDKDFEELPENFKKYIKYGEEKGFHLGYKTRIRKRWYITPSRWKPDGFALRQVGLYPKIIQNITEATSTDTIHRIKFKEGEIQN